MSNPRPPETSASNPPPEPVEVAAKAPYTVTQWPSWMRQFVAILLILGCVVAVILLGPIAQILIASFLIALLMYFPVRFLSQRLHVTYKLVVALLYLVLIGLLVFGVLSVIPLVTRAVNDLNRSVTIAYQQTLNYFRNYSETGRIQDYFSIQTLTLRAPENSGLFSIAGVTVDANSILRPIRDALLVPQRTVTPTVVQANSFFPTIPNIDFSSIFNVITGLLGGILGSITGIASTGLLALFISFLILIELPSYEREMLKIIPEPYHREVGLLTVKVMRVWGGFFRGQFIVGVIIGVLTWGQLALMGIPGAVPLAIAVAIVSLIPNIGGIIALLPLAIVPLLQGSTTIQGASNVTIALLVVVVNLAISQVIWNIVAPSIIGDALDLPLPVIIVGVFFGAAIGGIVGAFLIAPILGSLRVIVIYLLRKITQQDPFPGESWAYQATR
jgi:predicted PurR-regulated permease PerM